ncbi:anti-phage dCTP deaminase [Photorhabdus heterorhabditis]|uniref:anti-phage dCTP deaminase n=1 Tax=Photorhabdus heterorhabditis TaxID=880156 RepID=UPI0015627572|nr:anti-phage dCTP deaminase [Photorhabdus heterorhabditis]NRN29884.1 cytidine deaminase [Photorhabdus heterorhabditis subsp. aluminescens]
MININKTYLSEDNQVPCDFDSEVVIGLVSAVGTDLEIIKDSITQKLNAFRYDVQEVRISSEIISVLRDIPPTKDNYEKISCLMSEGNYLREISQDNSILALAAVAEINKRREKKNSLPIPSIRRAYIINSLKHPDEVNALREIYANGFFLIGVYTSESQRLKNLTVDKGIDREKAKELISRDSNEGNEWGQHTRDTYELSDFFISYDGNKNRTDNNIWRILDLIFGNPYVTPTFDEYAMFMAFSASLRSGDLSRQVGAVLTKNKNIISTGANDVPKFGGGLYWPEYVGDEIEDTKNGRDYKLGNDSNAKEKILIIEDILKNVKDEKKEEFKEYLLKSKIKDITEYGRVVHAEMEAILACARSNISTYNGILYCTTFPCHNCAKHIVASGIKRVVYIEPYPKSKAFDFHPDSISTPEGGVADNKVIFEPFVGVGPRCFFNLFSINLGVGYKIKRKNKEGKTFNWDRRDGKLRMKMLSLSYIEKETESAANVDRLIKELKK